MKRILRVIISVILLGASVITAVGFVWPKYQEYSLLKAQIEEKKDRLASGEQALDQLEKTQEMVSARQSDFDKLQAALPQDAGLPVVYDHVQKLGGESGLVVTSIEGSAAEDPVKELETLVFRVELIGSYEGLKSFLVEAKRSSRILNVNTLSIAGDGESPGALNIEVELVAYANP